MKSAGRGRANAPGFPPFGLLRSTPVDLHAAPEAALPRVAQPLPPFEGEGLGGRERSEATRIGAQGAGRRPGAAQ